MVPYLTGAKEMGRRTCNSFLYPMSGCVIKNLSSSKLVAELQIAKYAGLELGDRAGFDIDHVT